MQSTLLLVTVKLSLTAAAASKANKNVRENAVPRIMENNPLRL